MNHRTRFFTERQVPDSGGSALRSCLALLAAAMLMNCGGWRNEEGGLEDQRYEVRNGAVVDGGKWGSVMIGQSVGYGCSGTMLTHTWAISAHHCFFNAQGQPLPGPWYVQYGGTRGNPTQTVVARRVIPHPINTAAINPDVATDLRGVDAVLIELSSPISPIEGSTNFVRPLLKGPSSSLANANIICAGWGAYDDQLSWSWNLREAVLTVSRVDVAKVENPGGMGTKVIHAGDWVMYGRNSQGQIPMPGDSGSGCYLYQDGAYVLASVHSGGNSWEGHGYGLGDDVVRNWISEYIPNYSKAEKLRPGASSWTDRLDLYWRSSDGQIMHKWYPYNSGWSWDQALGGAATSAPGAFSRGTGRLNVLWRGTDFHVKHRWYPYGSDWSSEQDLGGTSLSAASGAAVTADEMQLFWRGLDNTLRRRRYTTSTDWLAEETVNTGSERVASAPTVTVRSNGIVDVFWRGTDSRLKHVWYTNGTASGVENLGGDVASDPAATFTDGRLHLFWQDSSRALIHRWYPWELAPNQWSPPVTIANGLETGPAVSSRGPGRLDVYWRSINKIRHIWYPYNGSWSWVEDLGGDTQP